MSRMLTAEQVREAIERHFGKVAVLDDGKPVEWRDDWVCKVAIDYRAIADELNAMLNTRAERTCMNVWDVELTGRLRFQCSECGAVSLEITPRFCPNCGRKVVDQ